MTKLTLLLTPAAFAASLNGAEYDRHWPSKDRMAEAKATGLVMVCGGSDDRIEFYGAIDDEEGAWDGTTVRLDAQGLVDRLPPLVNDPAEAASLYAWADRHRAARTITAVWKNEAPGPAWTYETDIPHATFDLMEDGEPWCRGIVFRLADLPGGAPAPRLTLTTPVDNPKYEVVGGQIVNRSKGEAIPPDEPVFILRAKDGKSLAGLRGYLAHLDATEPGSPHRDAVARCAEDFEAFQAARPGSVKAPDTVLPQGSALDREWAEALAVKVKAADDGFFAPPIYLHPEEAEEAIPVIDKLFDEAWELRDAETQDERADEFGDVLGVLSNYARHWNLDPASCLARANAKFRRRYAHVERRMAEVDLPPHGPARRAALEGLWCEAKALEKQGLLADARGDA